MTIDYNVEFAFPTPVIMFMLDYDKDDLVKKIYEYKQNIDPDGVVRSNENGWEYPLWVMTKSQKNKFYPEIFYINVKNRSNSSTYNKIDKEPCIELALFSYNIRIK